MSVRNKIYIEVHKGEFVSRKYGSSAKIHTKCNELNHPRTLAGNRDVLAKTLKDVLSKHTSIYDKIIKPVTLLHLVAKFEGGYTTSEISIFQQMCLEAGAGFCLMCDDEYDSLTDEQLKAVFKIW